MQEKYLTFLKYFSHFITNTLKYFQECSFGDIYEKMSFCLLSFCLFWGLAVVMIFHIIIYLRAYIYYNNNLYYIITLVIEP